MTAHTWQGSCCLECEADVSWCDHPPTPAYDPEKGHVVLARYVDGAVREAAMVRRGIEDAAIRDAAVVELRRLGYVVQTRFEFADTLADERDRTLKPFEDLFSGGPDIVCRTTWRREPGWSLPEDQGTPDTECVEVPLDDLNAAFDAAEQRS